MPNNQAAPRFNAGLDTFCWQTGNQTVLARTRLLRLQVVGKKNFYPKDQFDKAAKRILSKAQALGLVRVFRDGYQFRSEAKALRELLKSNRVSISQKQQCYVVARDYTPVADPKHPLDTTTRLRHMSYAVAVLSFLDNTGQQKISSRIGLCRQTVNEKCKKNPYLKTKQNWVRLTNLFQNQMAHGEKLKGVLGQYNLNAMRVGKDGWLYRQIANRYAVRNLVLNFEDHKTFRFSNKVLNRYFFTGVAKSNCPVPANKYIAMVRSQSARSERNAHGARVKKSRLRTALEVTDDFFGQRTDRFQVKTWTGPKMVEHDYRYLKTPYASLSRELNLLKHHGLLMEHEPYNRKILQGSFLQVSNKGMHKQLRKLREGGDTGRAMAFLKNRNDYQSGAGRGMFKTFKGLFSNFESRTQPT